MKYITQQYPQLAIYIQMKQLLNYVMQAFRSILKVKEQINEVNIYSERSANAVRAIFYTLEKKTKRIQLNY